MIKIVKIFLYDAVIETTSVIDEDVVVENMAELEKLRNELTKKYEKEVYFKYLNT